MDLVRRLRGQYPERHIPIVMVTTEKLVQKVEEALEDGVDCFISKPFTAEGFEKRLGPVIEKLRQAKQPSGFFQRLVA
jgi:PleD family two-component response regulator